MSENKEATNTPGQTDSREGQTATGTDPDELGGAGTAEGGGPSGDPSDE